MKRIPHGEWPPKFDSGDWVFVSWLLGMLVVIIVAAVAAIVTGT
jgi:hypothetical protein